MRFAVLLLLLAGCGPRPAVDVPVVTDGSFPRTVTDSLGVSVTVPARPARIVCTSPANTEILFAVGAGGQVVGNTTYCTHPPAAATKEKVGGFDPKTISTETVVGLAPDLVVTDGGVQAPLAATLRGLGLTVVSFDATSFDGVVRNVRQLGGVTGHAAEADVAADALVARAEKVRGRVAAVPLEQRPRVLLLLSDDTLMTAGPKTFTGELLDRAGGRNLFADATAEYPRVSEEEVVRRNPDAIVVWQMGRTVEEAVRAARRPAWKDLTAVRTGRILHVDDDLLSRPGPRLFDGLEKLAEVLHPAK